MAAVLVPLWQVCKINLVAGAALLVICAMVEFMDLQLINYFLKKSQWFRNKRHSVPVEGRKPDEDLLRTCVWIASALFSCPLTLLCSLYWVMIYKFSTYRFC